MKEMDQIRVTKISPVSMNILRKINYSEISFGSSVKNIKDKYSFWKFKCSKCKFNFCLGSAGFIRWALIIGYVAFC